jgi:uncharacterized DUF497 family protein
MASFLYEFDWDPGEANTNFHNHGVDFERAAQVFRDPLALTIPDDEHSGTEVRGYAGKGHVRPIRVGRSHV